TWVGALVLVGVGAPVLWVSMRRPARVESVREPAIPGADDRHRELEALNARLFDEARQSAGQYQALFEVAGLVSSSLDVERVLDLIVDRCQALVGVASVGIFKLDPETGALTYERGSGLSAEFVRALRLRAGEGTTGRAVRDRTPAWTADILADRAIALTAGSRDPVT